LSETPFFPEENILKNTFFSNKQYVYAQIIAYNIDKTITKTSVGPLSFKNVSLGEAYLNWPYLKCKTKNIHTGL